jgi:hypothetical protein
VIAHVERKLVLHVAYAPHPPRHVVTPVDSFHSATVPAIRIEGGIGLTICPPRRVWIRIHGSNGSPFSRVHLTYCSIGLIG